MEINDELKIAQLDKDWNNIKRIFDKINNICEMEADMDVLEFLKYKKNTAELCRFHSLHSNTKVGPYKWDRNGVEYKTSIGRRFQEDAINDMDMGEQ